MFRKVSQSLLAAGLVFGTSLMSVAELKCDDSVPKDVEKLQGSWLLVYQLFDGTEPPACKEKTILSFDKEKFTIRVGVKVTEKGEFKGLDSNTIPKRFDYAPAELNGIECALSYPAIYLIQDDVFMACVNYDGKRPKAFSAEAKTRNELVIYKRVKK
jgi:uncharacterized protein (TIGR03067 family)